MDAIECQRFALVYIMRTQSFGIYPIERLVDFDSDFYDNLRDGHRVYSEVRSTGGGKGLLGVLVQLAKEENLLKESLAFCCSLKKKKLSVEEIRSHLEPIRLENRRQHLPPYEVSNEYQ